MGGSGRPPYPPYGSAAPRRSRGAPRPPGELALLRSALWEALALGFLPPAAETIARLAAPDGARALADVAAEIDAGGGGVPLAPLVRALAVDPTPTVEALGRVYGALFGHTARGAAPPYETEYGEDSLWAPQREMSDLGGFFAAFGLRVDPAARERPDHIACACEFLVVLARREARALATGDPGLRETSADAARLFLRDHLGRWAPAFGARVAGLDPAGFYGALGRLLAGVVAAECARTGVAAGPVFVRLRSAEPDATPAACGPAVATPEA